MSDVRSLIRIAAYALLSLAAACTGPRHESESPAAAQALERPVVLAGPTLVVVIPRPAGAAGAGVGLDSTVAAARRLAEPLGYRVEVRYASAARLIDTRGHAVYEPPHNVIGGYIIMAPYLRPLLIRGRLSPADLTRELSDYGRVMRPLET